MVLVFFLQRTSIIFFIFLGSSLPEAGEAVTMTPAFFLVN
jgi:hypothetical protein